MKLYKEFITELFDNPLAYHTVQGGSNPIYEFEIKGIRYLAGFTYVAMLGGYNFGFAIHDAARPLSQENLTQTISDVGLDVANRVFATSIAIVKDFVKKNNPDKVIMLADTSEGVSRLSVYEKIIKRNLTSGYSLSTKKITFAGSQHQMFIISK